MSVNQADLERLLLKEEIEEFLHAEAELLDDAQRSVASAGDSGIKNYGRRHVAAADLCIRTRSLLVDYPARVDIAVICNRDFLICRIESDPMRIRHLSTGSLNPAQRPLKSPSRAPIDVDGVFMLYRDGDLVSSPAQRQPPGAMWNS